MLAVGLTPLIQHNQEFVTTINLLFIVLWKHFFETYTYHTFEILHEYTTFVDIRRFFISITGVGQN